MLAGEAGLGVAEVMLFGAEETNGVVEEDVALDVIGEVSAGDKFESGGGADAVVFFEDAGWFGSELAVVDIDGTGSHPVEVGVGSFEEEGLAKVIESGAPWVGDGEAGGAFEVVALRAVAEEASVRATDGAVGGFDITVEEGAFAHVDGAGGVSTEGADDVVGVVVVETAQDDFADIGFVVAVGIF